jgi:histidine triad (HIT) family protein
MDCVFCAIVAGEASASQVYEDDRVVAFMDIAPATPGHVLVVPRAHEPSLIDLDAEDGARMFQVAQQLARALRRSAIPAEGINLLMADGEVALQDVFHAHLHVVPRTDGDGFTLSADFGDPSRDLLDAQAADIRSVLNPPGYSGRERSAEFQDGVPSLSSRRAGEAHTRQAGT